MNIRIGNGYDIHRLVEGRPLILGGVNIPHELGLLGHSDADVLTHAIMDAMLGALSLGDIGHYFPPTDPQWAGADSLVLLEQVHRLIWEKGWQIGNIDSVVVAERPKLKPHIEKMRDRLADVLKLKPDQIGIKATTNEKLGPVGREEGIASHAVVLLVPASKAASQPVENPQLANAQTVEIKAAIVPDIAALDKDDRLVMLVKVQEKAVGQTDISDVICWLKALSIVVPFAMTVDPEDIQIFQWDGDALSPVCSLKTADAIGHYSPEFGSGRVVWHYLCRMVEAWLDDLAYHWKSEVPPASEQIAGIGLLQRLQGGTTQAQMELRGDIVRRD